MTLYQGRTGSIISCFDGVNDYDFSVSLGELIELIFGMIKSRNMLDLLKRCRGRLCPVYGPLIGSMVTSNVSVSIRVVRQRFLLSVESGSTPFTLHELNHILHRGFTPMYGSFLIL